MLPVMPTMFTFSEGSDMNRLLSATLLTLSLLCFNVLSSAAQETETSEWHASVGGGMVTPVAPLKFDGFYITGFSLHGSISGEVNKWLSAGLFFSYMQFPHTGKALSFKDRLVRCIDGGEKAFFSFGMTLRTDIYELAHYRLYASVDAGLTEMSRSKATYSMNGMAEGMAMYAPEASVTNEYVAGVVGIEYRINYELGVAVESGYGLGSDGVVSNQFVPVRVLGKIRL